jgi:hypothetical protein
MTQAVRQIVRVKPGGVIEIRSPDLAPGTVAEVIVLTESTGLPAGKDREQELAALLKETRALPQARAISDEEIAAEIAAYRAGRA